MTYFKDLKRSIFQNGTRFVFYVSFLTLFVIVPSLLQTQALDSKPINVDRGNSQTLELLSPVFSTKLPQSVGGPLYTAKNKKVLVSNIGILTDSESFKETIEDTHGISFYVVRQGDTLSGIADLFDVSVNTIKWENNLSKNTLKVGKELRILPVSGVSHIIKKGETFSKIAHMYDVEVTDITIFNNFDEKSLKIGTKIIIPNGIKKKNISKNTSSKKGSKISRKKIGGRATSGYYMRPNAGRVTSKFGPRWGKFHYGIDFGGAMRTPIVAAASGVVEKTYCGRGYGNCLIIKHGNGARTLYAHANKLYVSIGAKVKQGQKIAEVGRTGHVTGPHLHFEIKKANGQRMNPNSLFR